jgi:hypothetical protein
MTAPKTYPIYDVCGVAFIPGMCDFNMHNVLGALRSVGISERRCLYAQVHIVVYDNLWARNQLEFVGSKVMYNTFEVTIDPGGQDLNQPVVNSHLSDGKKFVTLRTREF